MKLVRAGSGGFTFQIEEEEKRTLFKLLQLYPMVPPAHQPVSRGESRPEDQALLEGALQAQRTERKRQVERMMKAPTRFRQCPPGWRFSLKPTEMEWLLQVFNDLRVGSWLQLGSPDPLDAAITKLDSRTAPFLFVMEAAGFFEMVLLRALTGRGTDADEEVPLI